MRHATGEEVAERFNKLVAENNRLENEVKYLNARCNSYAEMGVRKDQEIERLRARLTEARDYVGKNYMPSGLLARIDAALKGGEEGGEAPSTIDNPYVHSNRWQRI